MIYELSHKNTTDLYNRPKKFALKLFIENTAVTTVLILVMQ